MLQNFITLLFLVLLPTFSLCTLLNVSIDDQLGDERTGAPITYSFGWSFGPNCTDCEAALDATQVFDHTWHDTSFAPTEFGGDGAIRSANATFNGTAVYVVCILTHGFSNPNGNTDMTFFLDGQPAGSLEEPPTGNSAYLYDQVVFSMTDLPSGVHNISVEIGHNGTSSLILFDRFIYTTDVLPSESTTPSTTLPPLTITEVNSLSNAPTSNPSSSFSSPITSTFASEFYVMNMLIYVLLNVFVSL